MDKLATMQKELLDGLDQLMLLESNWDGYNASKFDKKTIDNSKHLLDLFSKNIQILLKKSKIFSLNQLLMVLFILKLNMMVLNYRKPVLELEQNIYHHIVSYATIIQV